MKNILSKKKTKQQHVFLLEAEEEDDDQPVTQYRIRGQKPKLILSDPTTEMVLSRMVDGQYVREAEIERVNRVRHQPPPQVMPHSFTTNDQRLFARVHGTMGLSCILAVQKAYKVGSTVCALLVILTCPGVWISFSSHSPNWRAVQYFHLPSQKTPGQKYIV
jgi:hypothetical protein